MHFSCFQLYIYIYTNLFKNITVYVLKVYKSIYTVRMGPSLWVSQACTNMCCTQIITLYYIFLINDSFYHIHGWEVFFLAVISCQDVNSCTWIIDMARHYYFNVWKKYYYFSRQWSFDGFSCKGKLICEIWWYGCQLLSVKLHVIRTDIDYSWLIKYFVWII